MDNRQDTLPIQPVFDADRTDIHNAGGDGLLES